MYRPGYDDAEQGEVSCIVPAPEGAWEVEGGLEVGGLERVGRHRLDSLLLVVLAAVEFPLFNSFHR